MATSEKLPIEKEKMPRHVAIIMDGNRRWAKQRGMIGALGYRSGVLALRPIIEACGNFGIKALTIFAFSTENWARPKDEVDFLMGLIEEFFFREIDELNERGVRIRVLGEPSALPEKSRAYVEKAVQITAGNDRVLLNIALNYGSRQEIVRAAKDLARAAKNGRIDPEHINERMFEDALYTRGLPDVDLLIRTSGEYRISNFLLYQLAYAEFVVTDLYWPDFGEQAFADALREYAQRQRRFGKE